MALVACYCTRGQFALTCIAEVLTDVSEQIVCRRNITDIGIGIAGPGVEAFVAHPCDCPI